MTYFDQNFQIEITATAIGVQMITAVNEDIRFSYRKERLNAKNGEYKLYNRETGDVLYFQIIEGKTDIRDYIGKLHEVKEMLKTLLS